MLTYSIWLKFRLLSCPTVAAKSPIAWRSTVSVLTMDSSVIMMMQNAKKHYQIKRLYFLLRTKLLVISSPSYDFLSYVQLRFSSYGMEMMCPRFIWLPSQTNLPIIQQTLQLLAPLLFFLMPRYCSLISRRSIQRYRLSNVFYW